MRDTAGRRWWALLLAAAPGAGAAADDPVTVLEIAPDFIWGYNTGVKQPLGAYKDGLSVHQITKRDPAVNLGNPDYVLWADETMLTGGVSERPTGAFDGNVVNAGGMVSYSDDGTIWYTFSGRAQDLPLRLYSSVQPYDVTDFDLRLPGWDASPGSTAPCVTVDDPWVMLTWRHSSSGVLATAARFRRYNYNVGFLVPDLEIELGRAEDHPTLGRVGIEQLWSRFDPRYGHTFYTWQFFHQDEHRMGSNPFLYSDDAGATWRAADGGARSALPIHYSEIDAVLVPDDHLAGSDSTSWYSSDLGISPGGVFWMTLRSVVTGIVDFWLFDGKAWVSRPLAVLGLGDAHACGVTKDCITFVYSEAAATNLLKARYSIDDGDTWSDPVVVDSLDPSYNFSWVSFAQPVGGYPDNAARFFYTYSVAAQGVTGLNYLNRVRWMRLDVAGLRPPDLDGDGDVDKADLFAMFGDWGPCGACSECPADLDIDCSVGITDLFALFGAWSP